MEEKKQHPKCGAYDLRAIESWLAEQAAEGLELTGEWPYFERGEARRRRFFIEPARDKGGVPEALLHARALAGWEYVCSKDKGAFYVWRSTSADAQPPRPREMAGSWAEQYLRRKLLWAWLAEAAALALVAGFAAHYIRSHELLVWSLVTRRADAWNLLSILLSLFCAFWATRRDFRDRRRLRRAIREGTYLEPVAQHTAFYEIMRLLPVAAATLVLLVTCSANGGAPHDDFPAGRDETLTVRSEALGGESGEFGRHFDRTYFGGGITVIQEGDYRGMTEFYQVYCETQLEVYEPKLKLLAKPLTAELRDWYAEDKAQAVSLDNADEAYYWRWGEKAQYLLLRGGGTVLLYRTEAPDDLREHLEAFEELLAAYREIR